MPPAAHFFPELMPRERLQGPVLVLAPHPDDETIGCGGMLAHHAASGHRVVVVHATDGGGGDPEGRFGDVAGRRLAEERRALAVLGVGERRGLGFADGALADGPELEAALAALIAEVAPATLYSLSPFEYHPDHRALAFAAARAAARSCPAESVCMLFGVNSLGLPTVLCDITDLLEVKERALHCFATQLAYLDFATKVLGRDRAATVNIPDPAVLACEAFARLAPGRLEAYFAAAARLEDALHGA